MIVNARDKLKSWAGLVCLFNKWNIMQTNLPCKQIEKTGNVATPRPPPKKNTKKTQTKSTQGTAATRGKGKKTTEKGGFAYCPATEVSTAYTQANTSSRHSKLDPTARRVSVSALHSNAPRLDSTKLHRKNK